MYKYAIPEYITSDEIKSMRKQMELTQAQFAKMLGVSKPTVERWETSKKEITGPITMALHFLRNDDKLLEQIRIPEKGKKLRLMYMYKNELCTLIDVDEINRDITVKNYKKNIMFRAFGAVDTPDYEDYMEFLKSRCFPETRDKLKLVLKDLNVPFYDPLLIIEKTKGKMAEDDFWIEVVK